MIERFTERDLIRSASKRWDAQYSNGYPMPGMAKKGDALRALDGETATAKEVTAIVGNDTWTNEWCDVCNRRVSFGFSFMAERATVVCDDCVRKMSAMMSDADSGKEAFLDE